MIHTSTVLGRVLAFALVLSFAFITVVRADDEEPIDGSLTADYNVGGGFLVEHATRNEVSATDTVGGAVANLELTVSGPLSNKHFMILDVRALAFIGGGAQVAGQNSPMALFSLRLIGSVAGGLMAFKVLPANIAFEDLDLKIRNTQVSGSALIGTTLYLPVNLLTRLDDQNLYLAVTPGLCYNSDGGEAAFAFQTKLRYASDKYSAEIRYLMTLASRTEEKKGVLQVAVNHLFMERDQLGIYVSKGVVTDRGGSVLDLTEATLFYGGSF